MRPPKSPAKSIHHVAMYVTESPSNEDKISGIISQTDVIRCLHTHEQQVYPISLPLRHSPANPHHQQGLQGGHRLE